MTVDWTQNLVAKLQIYYLLICMHFSRPKSPRRTTGLFFTALATAASPLLHGLDGSNPVFLASPPEGGGWKTFELLQYQDTLGTRAKEGFVWNSTMVDWDGLGAYLHDPSTLRVFINHEETASTFSRVDLDVTNLKAWIANGIEDNSNSSVSNQVAAPGPVVTAMSRGWLSIDPAASGTLLDRPCSANVWLADTFGPGLGFADSLFLTGEEVTGGRIWVMDLATRVLYEAPDLSDGRWENAAPIDTGRSDTIAIVLSEDIGGGSAGALNGTAPLRLYVGTKNPAGDFLERNGLKGGKIYHWNATNSSSTNGTIRNGTTSDLFGAGTGTVVNGTWTSSSTGAVLFAKAEDVHPNMNPLSPGFGKELVLASQGQGIFKVDFTQTNFVSGDLASGQSSDILVLYEQGTQDYTTGFTGMDNLTWASDGMIYVNEDDGEGDMWRLDPASLEASFAQGDFTPTKQQVTYILDANFASESSGVIEISDSLDYPPGSVFLASAQGGINQLALIAAPTQRMNYDSEFGGNVSGDLAQWIARGNDGTTVTATPETGYAFLAWSDGSTNATRTDLDVTADIDVTAFFAPQSYLTWVDSFTDFENLDALPGADFDGDGLTNFTEYATALDPTINDRENLESGTGLNGVPFAEIRPSTTGNGERLTMEFIRRRNAPTLTYTVEFSDDPGFSACQKGNGEVVTSIDTNFERVVIQDPQLLAGETRRFVRMRFSAAPAP